MDSTQTAPRPSMDWQAIVEIAVCPALPDSAKQFAVDELRRLGEYLDDARFFAEAVLHVEPFSVGKPSCVEGLPC